MIPMQQAITNVAANRAQRICVPGKWRVWREGEQVKYEILDTEKNASILAEIC